MDTVDGETLNHLLLDNATQLLFQKRRQNIEHFRSELDDIIDKYSQDFDGDEIDLETMEVVNDRGHLRTMQHELDPITRPQARSLESEAETRSTENDATGGGDAGWESDESLDELSAIFFTSPSPSAKRKRLAIAHENKENLRPVLVDVTAASYSNVASSNEPSPSPPVHASLPAPDVSGMNLNTDTISTVQAFLAMGKRLETLLQAAVQPSPTVGTRQIANSLDVTSQPQKRRRIERPAFQDADFSAHDLEHRITEEASSPAASNDDRCRDSDTSDKRRRENTPGNCSIWQPQNENTYRKPKSAFYTVGGKRAYTKRQKVPTTGSGLRNEVVSDGLDSNAPASESESAENTQNDDRMITRTHAQESSESHEPARSSPSRNQTTQDKLSGVFKRGRGRPAVQFSADEDNLLLDLCQKGTPWSAIFPHFPGKSTGQVLYHHKVHLSPQVLPSSVAQEGTSTDSDMLQRSIEAQLSEEQDFVNMLPMDDLDLEKATHPSPPRSLPNAKTQRRHNEVKALSSPAKSMQRTRQQKPFPVEQTRGSPRFVPSERRTTSDPQEAHSSRSSDIVSNAHVASGQALPAGPASRPKQKASPARNVALQERADDEPNVKRSNVMIAESILQRDGQVSNTFDSSTNAEEDETTLPAGLQSCLEGSVPKMKNLHTTTLANKTNGTLPSRQQKRKTAANVKSRLHPRGPASSPSPSMRVVLHPVNAQESPEVLSASEELSYGTSSPTKALARNHAQAAPSSITRTSHSKSAKSTKTGTTPVAKSTLKVSGKMTEAASTILKSKRVASKTANKIVHATPIHKGTQTPPTTSPALKPNKASVLSASTQKPRGIFSDGNHAIRNKPVPSSSHSSSTSKTKPTIRRLSQFMAGEDDDDLTSDDDVILVSSTPARQRLPAVRAMKLEL